jgi:hypothetical protein
MKRQIDTKAFPTDIAAQVRLLQHPAPISIRATLVGANRCAALGITAHGSAPVLALCLALVAAGHDPRRPLHAYRGDVLALKVRSIGEGAQLTVEDDRHGRPRFRAWRKRSQRYGAASQVAQTTCAGPQQHPPRAKDV